MELNTKQKGNVTELACILALVQLGYVVSVPYGNTGRYDLVVDINNKLYRIQCKTSRGEKDGNAFSFSTSSISTHYSKRKVTTHTYENDIDMFMTCYDNKVYMIPIFSVKKYSCVLRLKPTKNNQECNINLASDYELENIIKRITLNK